MLLSRRLGKSYPSGRDQCSRTRLRTGPHWYAAFPLQSPACQWANVHLIKIINKALGAIAQGDDLVTTIRIVVAKTLHIAVVFQCASNPKRSAAHRTLPSPSRVVLAALCEELPEDEIKAGSTVLTTLANRVQVSNYEVRNSSRQV
jgi:hypothetical protein